MTQAQGYAIHDASKWTDFKVESYDLKPETEDDVTLRITACGVCGSDVHTITGGWGEFNTPFIVPGHEIVGVATSVGKNVQGIKVGDRVGVGAQVGSCGSCFPCKDGDEQYCVGDDESGMAVIDTYNAKYPDGAIAQGGYSSAIRAHHQFVFPIPDEIVDEDAASMLCGGLTVYSPLLRNGAGPGKKVAVVGLGGLGHYAVLFASAMGAEVTVISHSPKKKQDALKMGASHFIATGEEKDWYERFGRKEKPFDLIISTASSNAIDVPATLSTLSVHGKLIFVGMPEEPIKAMRIQAFAGNGAFFGSSHIGSKKEAISMLKLAAEKKIKPWIEVLPMNQCSLAVKRVHENDIRYRFVLKQDLVKA